MKKLLLLTIPVLLMLGCKPKTTTTTTKTTTPDPKACFDISTNLLDSGQTLTTTNCSTNASVWTWNFGQGISSTSTANNPSWVYSIGNNKATSNAYTVSLTAYNADKSKTSITKDTVVYMGFRQIDSIVLINAPGSGLPNDSADIFQFGPNSLTSQYSSPAVVVKKLPVTFNLESLNIIITTKNNQYWKGRLINSQKPGPAIATFGTADNIFLSRGITSPIVISSGGFQMDFYYHLIKK
jgi:PKD repeat protein